MKKSALTRLNLLEKAFSLIYTKGYHATSVDDIIASTAVTKGAFYYHFKTKDEMGLAIVKEIVRPRMEKLCIEPLSDCEDPTKTIYAIVCTLLTKDPFLQWEHGCPVSNFTQELAPWNLTFTTALNEFVSLWLRAIVNSFKKAKDEGVVKQNVDSEQVAYQVVAGYWGIRNVGKIDNAQNAYNQYLKGLKVFLDDLCIN